MMAEIIPIERGIAERGFEAAYQARGNAGADWLRPVRAKAFERFATAGLPHRRMEGWRWTDLRTLSKTAFVPARRSDGAVAWDEAADPFVALAEWRVVLVNGYLRQDLSRLDGLPDGVSLLSLADDPEAENLLARYPGPDGGRGSDPGAFGALNSALLEDGLVLRIADGARIEQPIHIVHLCSESAEPIAAHGRLIVIAGAGADATVLESHAGPTGARYLSNVVAQLIVGPGATLRHYVFQDHSRDAFHVGGLDVEIAEGGTCETFLFATGAALSRNEGRVRLAGPGASVALDGAYLMAGRQVFDATTVINHGAPGCSSREVFKGVVDEQARGVFQGRIAVAPHAQKTDAHQLHKALLLSQGAEVDTKPELEIFADDVKCSHGTAIGQLDADALFYLRARGIPLDEARALLVGAFVGEALDAIGRADVRDAPRDRVALWLERRAKGAA